MKAQNLLAQSLRAGEWDAVLAGLYALDGLEESLTRARARAERLAERFASVFSGEPSLFSGPGRTEIGGNHTDHQHGHVLCGSVDLDMLACAAPNGENTVRIQSEGYAPLELSLEDLSPRAEEQNSSAALVRGVAAGIREKGYALSGFDACVTSTVLSGSGLSSSAAYEVLIGNIFNSFCCQGRLDPASLAKVGQYAENVYFGKPCGLMDQMGSAVGGAVAIDFQNPADPVVKRVGYDFSKSGHVLCIVDSGSCHADLTGDYAAIPTEMGAVAAYFGKNVLRDVPETDFRASIPALRVRCGDRAVLRAIHFYDDDRCAVREAEALEAGDFKRFLRLVNESGLSSSLRLQNTWSLADTRQQAIPLALTLSAELLEGEGAARVHGGGFAGTIQAFVPEERLERFRRGMEAVLGQGMCHIIHIRPMGGCMLEKR